MLNLSSHPALQEGLVTVTHSISGMRTAGLIDPTKIKYVVINRHDPIESSGLGRAFPRVVERCLPQDGELFNRYLHSERDSGVSQLVAALLNQREGGLALTIEANRGVLDGNRTNTDKAIRTILNPEDPDAMQTAKQVLAEMHRTILDAVNLVLHALPKNSKQLELHSMEPYSTPNQPKLAHATLGEFVNAYLQREYSQKNARPTDIIIGTDGQPPVADMRMSNRVREFLASAGTPVAFNTPYDSEPGYPDFEWMVARPNAVFAVDLLKSNLCVIPGDDIKNFDTTCALPDPQKAKEVAEMLAEALKHAKVR